MGTDEAKWMTPMLVDSLTLAFPIHIKSYMPTWEEIPEEYRKPVVYNKFGPAKWLRFQNDWFMNGFEDMKIAPKEGINPQIAIKHLAMIQKSFEPKHQHKVAAVAYLASLWFEDVVYTVRQEKS